MVESSCEFGPEWGRLHGCKYYAGLHGDTMGGSNLKHPSLKPNNSEPPTLRLTWCYWMYKALITHRTWNSSARFNVLRMVLATHSKVAGYEEIRGSGSREGLNTCVTFQPLSQIELRNTGTRLTRTHTNANLPSITNTSPHNELISHLTFCKSL